MAISAKITTPVDVKATVKNNSATKTVGVQNVSKVTDSFTIDASEIPISLDNSNATNVRDALNGTATADATQTLTNKTINADNNTLSNVEVDNLKAGVLDTDLSSTVGTDTTLPSAKAVKTYVDTQVSGEDTLAEMNDTNLTSPVDGAILTYDNSSSKWVDADSIDGGQFNS
tara:strand:+ start:477 stop:992 length:516 start_codon:yes stop_codon:yes gene_type:complete